MQAVIRILAFFYVCSISTSSIHDNLKWIIGGSFDSRDNQLDTSQSNVDAEENQPRLLPVKYALDIIADENDSYVRAIWKKYDLRTDDLFSSTLSCWEMLHKNEEEEEEEDLTGSGRGRGRETAADIDWICDYCLDLFKAQGEQFGEN